MRGLQSVGKVDFCPGAQFISRVKSAPQTGREKTPIAEVWPTNCPGYTPSELESIANSRTARGLEMRFAQPL